MIEWVAEVLTRFAASGCGRMAVGFARGRKSARPTAQFVEPVLYLPNKTTDQAANKSEAKFQQATCLGLECALTR